MARELLRSTPAEDAEATCARAFLGKGRPGSATPGSAARLPNPISSKSARFGHSFNSLPPLSLPGAGDLHTAHLQRGWRLIGVAHLHTGTGALIMNRSWPLKQ